MKNFLLFILLMFSMYVSKTQTAADSMLQFIVQHKKNAALFSLKNDVLVASLNEGSTMPIATLSDLLVAIELAKQCTYKVLDTAERIPLKEIVKYNIDHPLLPEYENWFLYLLQSKKIKDNTVSLLEVAHGMLQFGVQANTEYLMDKVGFDNVKSSIISYNLANHTTIVPPMGSLALYQNRTGTAEKKILKAIHQMSDDEYQASSYLMHIAMKSDSTFKTKMPKNFINEKVMGMWSYNLAQGSVKSYASLLQTILKEKMLDAKFYKMLRKFLEGSLELEPDHKNKERFMTKRSSTVNTFSQAQYRKTQDGTEFVLVYTVSGLKTSDKNKLQNWYQDFESQLMTNTAFGEKVKKNFSLAHKK